MSRSAKVDAIRRMAQEQREGTRCLRCGRPTPAQDSDRFLEWEATGDGDQVVCPGCITPQEQQAIDEDAMAEVDKIRENRLRRAAERQGYRLKKSRRRDPHAYDYGLYWIIEPNRNWIVSGEKGSTLDEVEEWLFPDQMRSPQQAPLR